MPTNWERDFYIAARDEVTELTTFGDEGKSYDVFISHAWEDKEAFVADLASALVDNNLLIWYDDFVLKVGDSLTRSINRGLSGSRFGIVVLSPDFIAKKEGWPGDELAGLWNLLARDGRIIPIWHNVGRRDVWREFPLLVDRIAARSSDGMEAVVKHVMSVIRPRPAAESIAAIKQQRAIRRQDAFDRAYTLSERVRPLRLKMHSFPENYADWTIEQKEIGDEITRALNGIAVHVYKGNLEMDLILDEQAGTFIWSWGRLAPLVRELRRMSNQPERMEDAPPTILLQRFHFEWLAALARKRYPDMGPIGVVNWPPKKKPGI